MGTSTTTLYLFTFQGSLATCQLSEPLLWFILRVLDTSDALKAFHDMGKIKSHMLSF